MTAQTVTQAVEKRESGPVTIMWGKRAHFRAVLPASVDVEAFMGTAAGALYADEDLMKAARQHPDSLIVTLMRCAALGHMPGTDEFYLHIRKGKVAGTEGYRGVIERMYRSGAVAKVVVREVCARDPFRYVEGRDDKPVHEIGGRGTTGADFFGPDGSRDRGAMVGVYAYAQLTTGAISRVVILDRDDVMAARESSDAKDSKYSPWNRLDGGASHPELTGRSMWWKTAAKRLEPWVPTSAEYRREQLRASAAAANLAAPAPAAATGNGHPPVTPDDIVDAEVVGESQDVPGVAQGAGPAPGTTGPAAPDAPAPPSGGGPAAGPAPSPSPGSGTQSGQPARFRRLTKPALGKVKGALHALPLGNTADTFDAVSALAGRPVTSAEELSQDEAEAVLKAIDVELEAAGGDTEQAAEGVWRRVKTLTAQADGEATP